MKKIIRISLLSFALILMLCNAGKIVEDIKILVSPLSYEIFVPREIRHSFEENGGQVILRDIITSDNVDTENPILGLYHTKNNLIEIRKSEYKTNAIIHELGHYIWFKLMNEDERLAYEEIYKKEQVSNYAETNVKEGFAEAFLYTRLLTYRWECYDSRKEYYKESIDFVNKIIDSRNLD